MIGLFDADLELSSSSLGIPNLEIMKLAAFLKDEEKQFCRLILPGEETTQYEKIYYFANIPHIMPAPFRGGRNLKLGGALYHLGEYEPFDNILIDYTLPRTFIYSEFLNNKYAAGEKDKEINRFLDSSYYRMFAGNEQLPLPVVKRNKRLYIYDTNIFKDGWKDIMKELEERGPSTILCVSPIKCSNIDDLFVLRSFSRFSQSNTIFLDDEITMREAYQMARQYADYFGLDEKMASSIYFPLGGTKRYSIDYYKDIAFKLNLLYTFWVRGIKIRLKYVPPRIGYDNETEPLMQLIARWSEQKDTSSSIFSKLRRKPKEKELVNLFVDYFPSEKSLFLQNFDALKKKGVWYVWT